MTGAVMSGWKAGTTVAFAMQEKKYSEVGIEPYLAWWKNYYLGMLDYNVFLKNLYMPILCSDSEIDYLFSTIREALPTALDPYEIPALMGAAMVKVIPTIKKEKPGLLKKIEESGLSNIRIIQHDAVEVLKYMLDPGTLDGVHIFFPDPWPKKRHHKRRLIQPEFVALLCERLKTGGYLHAATDWEEYATHILATFSAEPRLVNTATDYAPRPDYRPLTKFEQRGLKLGHGVWDIVFRRVA